MKKKKLSEFLCLPEDKRNYSSRLCKVYELWNIHIISVSIIWSKNFYYSFLLKINIATIYHAVEEARRRSDPPMNTKILILHWKRSEIWIWIMKAERRFNDVWRRDFWWHNVFERMTFMAASNHVNKTNWKLNISQFRCRWSLNVHQTHRSDTEKNYRKFRLFYCVYKLSWALYHLFCSILILVVNV